MATPAMDSSRKTDVVCLTNNHNSITVKAQGAASLFVN